jgi:DNA or RNA helicases of superfamily II
MNGYIYVRCHQSYEEYKACKLGKASNIPERDSTYATGEIKRGKFVLVIEVPIQTMAVVETTLQSHFTQFHIEYNGGTEFYNKEIIPLIVPYLTTLHLVFKQLSELEIESLVRTSRLKKIVKSRHNYIPRDYQVDIINKSMIHLGENHKGMLVLSCGLGKTLISLWICQGLKCKSILVGVPNLLLLDYWKQESQKIFPNFKCMTISDVNDTDISSFLNHTNQCIVITTYSSSHKVRKACMKINYIFDAKILDEAHHLTAKNIEISNDTKTYINILHVESKYQIALTATMKNLEEDNDEEKSFVSNDNERYFGKIMEQKSLLWSIEKNIICDYVVQTILTKEEHLDDHFRHFHVDTDNDKRLFLSAFATLKSIYDQHSHHLFVYSNNKENAVKLVEMMNKLIIHRYFELPETYISEYHSDMKAVIQKQVLSNFKTSKYGVIACVYCLGEGYDLPLLDGVVFAENMSSNIRIVQSSLRACRKNTNEPNKISKFILPILEREDWEDRTNDPDLKK